MIDLEGQKVEYLLKYSPRAKKQRLTIFCDGRFEVTAPENSNLIEIENFIYEKSRWVLGKIKLFLKYKNSLRLPRSDRREYLKYKETARKFVRERLVHFNKIYNFSFSCIGIRNQKTRWGSCSKRGNLNFNYKIVFLPPELADYIIVHELCHLGEFNHSRHFWQLVEIAIPDYRKLRKQIKLAI